GGIADMLNQQVDPAKRRFRTFQSFDIVPKNGVSAESWQDYTVRINTNGQLAVMEFTGALPRASLFSNWQVNTNDDISLNTLADPSLDLSQTVLVGNAIPAPVAMTTGKLTGS